MIDVARNVALVRERAARAARRVGRDPGEVLLIAAAKTKGADLIQAALAAGVTAIGENYVQEAENKRAQVAAAACWHMIGHLQRNKAKRACATFDVIQTVDDLALGEALARQAGGRGQPVRVLVEVNLGGEASKSGVSPDGVDELIVHLRGLAGLSVEGLFTIPPPGPAERVRPYFRRLRSLRDALHLRELSMGMTDDFEIAIEEGATMIRVGRAIFGERPRA
jgi:pyridoxal phosphate enzyme (YggS family)